MDDPARTRVTVKTTGLDHLISPPRIFGSAPKQIRTVYFRKINRAARIETGPSPERSCMGLEAWAGVAKWRLAMSTVCSPSTMPKSPTRAINGGAGERTCTSP
jgi:hypothetical protein